MFLTKTFSFFTLLFFCLNAAGAGSVLISGKQINSKDQLHQLIAKELKFSPGYPKNLDALYDELSSDLDGDSIIKIKNLNLLRAKVGREYTDGFVQAIIDSAEENPRLILVLE